MNMDHNRRIVRDAFEALARGDGQPFGALMAEDFCWTITGTTPWSRSYRGRQAVYQELIEPLYAQFADRYTGTVQRVLADGEHAVVEFHGRVTTKRGQPYHNRYCFVIRLRDGRMAELTEYLDTELVAAALEAPA